jgi:hypothetical protein
MGKQLRPIHAAVIAALGFAAGLCAAGVSAEPAESFRALMDEAMARMHRDMTIPYSGDVDRDFVAMMIPHHQGAVDMAVLQLRFGRDERVRRLAQGIVVEQLQEIAVMKSILADLPDPGGAASPAGAGVHHHSPGRNQEPK